MRPLLSRPGGQLVVFAVGTAVSLALAIVVTPIVIGVLAIPPAFHMALTNALVVALVWFVSARVLAGQMSSTRTALGLESTPRRRREFGWGFVASGLIFLGVVAWQASRVNATWQLQGSAALYAVVLALLSFGLAALAEELVFRGAGFRALRAITGDWPAIALSSVAFGAYHLIGSQAWGTGLLMQFLLPTAGGVLFAWATVRSGGLALPLGIHWGGNWVTSGVATFTPRDGTQVQGLWHLPIDRADLAVLTSPDLIDRLPYLAGVALLGVVVYARVKLDNGRTSP